MTKIFNFALKIKGGGREGDHSYVKHTKNVKFFLVAEALTGLTYYRPPGKNFSFYFTLQMTFRYSHYNFKRNVEIGPYERLLPIFGTKNRIHKIGSCERALR